MPQTITRGYKALVDEANAKVETIPATEAVQLHGREDVVLVDLRDPRELEREGVIGKLHDEFISTSGLANPLSNTRRMGREMAERVKQLGIDAVILTST